MKKLSSSYSIKIIQHKNSNLKIRTYNEQKPWRKCNNWLNFFQISEISVDAFRQNPQLSSLYLNDNQLSCIAPTVFQAISQLRILNMGSNKLLTTISNKSKLNFQKATFPRQKSKRTNKNINKNLWAYNQRLLQDLNESSKPYENGQTTAANAVSYDIG